jgi:RNA polymerase sigma-70 factor (family 1)
LNIIEQIVNGYESAFNEIFTQYHKKLYFYFLKKSNSQEISKELVQLTFIKLWQFKHTLSESHSFDSQIFNIARTTFIDHLRHQSSLKNMMNNSAESTDDHEERFPSSYITNLETTDYLQQAIKSLSPARRNIFVLSRVQGLSNKEIATKLSISIKTVEDHMTKAVRQIRSISSI